jgi:two-component system NtrC family sensor kinase
MGMGLTVAYDIVSSLGGDIEVRSEDGKGTAFVITFPITKP